MKFFAVTPVRNGEPWIGDTVRSIVSQSAFRSGDHELEYVVMDGASTDATAAAAAKAGGTAVDVRSEPDQGMYDAVGKAWSSGSGDVYFYLNAGDLMADGALERVAEFLSRPSYHWVSGLTAYVSAPGSVVETVLPPRYDRRLIRAGRYGRVLPFIQQESQFWTAEAMSLIDVDRFREFRLAGDSYLWHAFAAQHSPLIIQAILGGWRQHGGHLSADMAAYWAEVATFADRATPADLVRERLERLRWNLPQRLKLHRTKDIAAYDKEAATWVEPAIR